MKHRRFRLELSPDEGLALQTALGDWMAMESQAWAASSAEVIPVEIQRLERVVARLEAGLAYVNGTA